MALDKYLLIAVAYASRYKDLSAEDFYFKVEELIENFKKLESDAQRSRDELNHDLGL